MASQKPALGLCTGRDASGGGGPWRGRWALALLGAQADGSPASSPLSPGPLLGGQCPGPSLGPCSTRWGINLFPPLAREQMHSPQPATKAQGLEPPHANPACSRGQHSDWWELEELASPPLPAPPRPSVLSLEVPNGGTSTFFPRAAALLTSSLLCSEFIKSEESKGELRALRPVGTHSSGDASLLSSFHVRQMRRLAEPWPALALPQRKVKQSCGQGSLRLGKYLKPGVTGCCPGRSKRNADY